MTTPLQSSLEDGEPGLRPLKEVQRPDVEFFIQATSKPYFAWGMADADVLDLCNYILRLEAGDWRPIETAPLGDANGDDGPRILVWDGSSMDVAYHAWNTDGRPVFYNDDVSVRATHWMPLPKPPSSSSERSEAAPTQDTEGGK